MLRGGLMRAVYCGARVLRRPMQRRREQVGGAGGDAVGTDASSGGASADTGASSCWTSAGAVWHRHGGRQR